MPQFNYTARNRAGERVDGSVDAPDRRSAMLQIERQGHTPITVGEVKPAAAAKPPRFAKTARPAPHAKPAKRAATPTARRATTEKPGRPFTFPGFGPRRPRMKSREVLFSPAS